HIFDLVRRTQPNEKDVLIDLGAGVGHVALLASICTPARIIGIEAEQGYVDVARQCAGDLRLRNVTFLHQDARESDLSAGTIFYLSTPFLGSILRTVLDSLRELRRRKIRVCTFGPCTAAVAQEPWLRPVLTPDPAHITVFCSTV